jgi:rhamnosyltransferase
MFLRAERQLPGHEWMSRLTDGHGAARHARRRAPPAAKVVAVVVTYFPDVSVTLRNLDAIRRQVDAVVVVDNGSADALWKQLDAGIDAGIKRIRLDRNLGIAKAQNLGAEWARSQAATHLVLFDQDSQPSPGTLGVLISAWQSLAEKGVAVGMIAPVFSDERQANPVPFFRLRDGKASWVLCDDSSPLLEIDTAIASGTLIPMEAMAATGGMNEAMFIDLVDMDWCFRARSLGLRNFCACRARLNHRLGDAPRKLLNREVVSHSPLRNYYFFRNAVWLFRQDYIPAAWKAAVARQLLRRYLVYPVLLAPRWQYLGKMTLGIWHGLRGRLGPL